MMFHRSLTAGHRKPPPAQPADPHIRLATLADLSFVLHLQKRFTNELGFLPTAALAGWIGDSCVWLVEENDEPAGYVVQRQRSNCARWARPLTQVAVAMDAQRRHLGESLLARVAAAAHGDLLEALQCWVADDIEAGDFFQSCGFQPICTRAPKNVRGRRLVLMRRSLQAFEPRDFWTIPRVAGCRPAILRATAATPIFPARPPADHAAGAESRSQDDHTNAAA